MRWINPTVRAMALLASSPAQRVNPGRIDRSVQFTPSTDAPTVRLFFSGVYSGHLQVNRVSMEDLYNMEMDEYSDSPNAVNYECTEAVLDLATFYGKGTPVFSAWRSAILRKHRGKGHGTYLYEEMLDYLKRTEGRHVILIPEDCLAGGGTSDDAWRVWASLSRRYVHGAFGVSSERLSD